MVSANLSLEPEKMKFEPGLFKKEQKLLKQQGGYTRILRRDL
jgi:hypothetical protein